MARKEYSDPTSEAVDRIEIQVDEIEILVTEIKETDLANLEENIYSPLNYDPFTEAYYNSAFPSGVWTEVINVTGEGFIESAYGVVGDDDVYAGIQIEVDGEIIFNCYGTNDSNDLNSVIGIANSKILNSSSKDTTSDFANAFLPVTSGVNYLSNAKINGIYTGEFGSTEINQNGNPPLALISEKIGFDSSLIVRMKSQLIDPVYAFVIGGVKK